MVKKILSLLCVTSCFGAFADEFHYKNVLIGERAAGMGGAFTAVSDDPSGSYYNPAGMAFSFDNYISLSANAYQSTKQVFKNVIAGQDYTLNSSSFVPAFFGFTQNVGRGKLSFSVVVPNYDLFDQEDEIKNTAAGPTDEVFRLIRKLFRQDATYLVGPSYSRELFDNFAGGVSLFVSYRQNKMIDIQHVMYTPFPTGKYYFQNIYLTDTYVSFSPKIGFQYMPMPKWAIGLTLNYPFKISATRSVKQIKSKVDATTKLPVLQSGSYGADIDEIPASGSSKGDIGLLSALSVQLGNAIFISKKFLVTFDIDYHLADSQALASLESGTVATFNLSGGLEYFVTDTLPIRVGVYTDRSMAPDLTASGLRQAPRVNLLGFTTSFSMITQGSSFTLGGSYALGTGKGQATSTGIQDLKQTQYSLFLMGSYQL